MMARASYKKHFVKSYLRQIFITCFTIKGSLQKNVPRTRSAVAVVPVGTSGCPNVVAAVVGLGTLVPAWFTVETLN